MEDIELRKLGNDVLLRSILRGATAAMMPPKSLVCFRPRREAEKPKQVGSARLADHTWDQTSFMLKKTMPSLTVF